MSDVDPVVDPQHADHWRQFLVTGSNDLERRGRRLFAHLPDDPRCKACNAPFSGVGGHLVRILANKRQSQLDPRYCNQCTDHMRKFPGGAEIDVSMLFADVRGSTTIAEGMAPGEFSQLINRFFGAATDVLLKTDAFIDRLIGDEVVAFFVPGLAGPDHAREALAAAYEILSATGHGDPDGPWIPVGIGVHTGVSYVGTVGTPGGAMDMTALGDVPNVAARLASQAKAGEIVVSETLGRAAGLDLETLERRQLRLKGRQAAVDVRLLRLKDRKSRAI